MAHIDDLIDQIRGLESEVQLEFDKKRDDLFSVLGKRRVSLSRQIAGLDRGPRLGLLRFVSQAAPVGWLVAPVIWLAVFPLALLDLFLLLYQAVYFPVYGIPKARRSDYVILDRGDLPYLNAMEKLNCAYCGYANGLAAYFMEVAARTEQYWCPIKHARRLVAAHDRYPTFFEFGDADSYRLGLERLRASMAQAALDDAGKR
jgi:hypothetical protein